MTVIVSIAENVNFAISIPPNFAIIAESVSKTSIWITLLLKSTESLTSLPKKFALQKNVIATGIIGIDKRFIF